MSDAPHRMKASAEQGALKLSIALTVFLGVLGVASGLVTGSQAITFDGMYSFVDVVPTVVSLLVVKLIARGTSHRFQYGRSEERRVGKECRSRGSAYH